MHDTFEMPPKGRKKERGKRRERRRNRFLANNFRIYDNR